METATGASGSRADRRTTAAAAALLAAYWLLAVTAIDTKSATYDEAAYVVGGYAIWTRHDYRLNAEGGHLSQRVAALPLLFARSVRFEADDSGAAVAVPDHLLFRARVATATFSALLGVLVFAWSRRLFGPAGGLVSLAAFAFCPTMLANGAVPHSDVASALFFLASAAGLWAVLHRLTWRRVAASCAAVAGLFLAKLSAPVMVAVGLVLAAVRVAGGRPLPVGSGGGRVVSGRWRIAGVAAGLVVLHAAAAWAAVWAAFGFRFAAAGPGDGEPEAVRRTFFHYAGDERAGWARGPLEWAYRNRVLPEAYLFGAVFQIVHTGPGADRPGFLNGEAYRGGRATFFPFSFAVKTPLPVFGLLGLAAWAWVRARRGRGAGDPPGPRLYDLTPLLALLAVYWVVALGARVNVGHRYLLPVYPPLFVLLGAAGWWLRPAGRRGWRAAATVALVAALAVESVLTWPHYLAYFNQAAGGPRNGYRRLVDSSLDWGQDLKGVRRWLDDRGLPTAETPAYLAYFGSAGVGAHGVRAAPLYTYPSQSFGEPPGRLGGGVYFVSATLLAELYVGPPDGPGGPDTERFARLAAYLRTREPDDTIGYSILVFRLTDDEVRAALQ